MPKWNPIEADGGKPFGEPPSQTLQEWWEEEAARHNRLGEIARKMGIQVGVPDTPPELNPDGSLKEDE